MAANKAEARSTKPTIDFDSITNDRKRRRIRVIDRHIKAKPFDFLDTLTAKRADILALSSEKRGDPDDIPHFGSTPFALIKEYFVNNYDKEVIFDDITEEAIAADEDHSSLLIAVQQAKSERVKVSAMQSRLRENAAAAPAREQARVSRLSLYIGQVAAFEQQASSPLPNTG